MISDRFANARRDLDEAGSVRRWWSPALYGVDQELRGALRAHARGRVLDVGCGAMPYRELIERHAVGYDGLDIEERTQGVRYVCSATDMSPVPDEAYDTVLCSEVLEHVADPTAALSEIHRVLRPQGRLILSVPFLGRLHEEPHDYYRYTRHGLDVLLGQVGLETETIATTGSVASFLGHQAATVLVAGTWQIPIVNWLAFALNTLLVTIPCRAFDAILGPIRDKLPLGYVVVAHKPAPPVGSDA